MAAGHDDLERALARALGPATRDDSLSRALAARVLHDDAPEASVRCKNGQISAGRMMIERSDEPTARLIAAGLALPWHDVCDALVETCGQLEIPLIVGWDVGSGGARYKLYANASDVAAETQRSLIARLGLPLQTAPQIVGLNVHASHVETKAYYQRARLAELQGAELVGVSWRADALPASLSGFAHAPAWVLSCDVDGGAAQARAVFAAVSHAQEPEAEALVEALAGVPWAALVRAFPFVPGHIRQLGWGFDGAVTVYAKRAGLAAPVHTLAPIAVFAMVGCEVGAFVQPSETTPRAFLRAAGHAISFRTRSGAPTSARLAELAEWIAAQLTHAATCGTPVALDTPPAPWRTLDAAAR